jgi:DNA-binding XRE family transcriptional regulator
MTRAKAKKSQVEPVVARDVARASSIARASSVSRVLSNVGAKCLHGTRWGWCMIDGCEGRRPKINADHVMSEDDYQRMVGILVGHFRRHRKMSQAQLAKRLGMAQSTLCRIEDGESAITAYHAALLSSIFDCAVSDIVVSVNGVVRPE